MVILFFTQLTERGLIGESGVLVAALVAVDTNNARAHAPILPRPMAVHPAKEVVPSPSRAVQILVQVLK